MTIYFFRNQVFLEHPVLGIASIIYTEEVRETEAHLLQGYLLMCGNLS